MSLQYASVEPETLREFYGENHTIDFVITFENRMMMLNNLRLCGDIRVVDSSGNRITTANNVFIDHMLGAHSVIEGVKTTFQNKLVETYDGYARYYSMLQKSTMANDDTMNGSAVCELKSPDDKITRNLLTGIDGDDVGFAIKPFFCLNNAVGDGVQLLSSKKSGVVRITFKLARNNAVLYGTDNSGHKYELRNVRLKYVTVPEDGSNQKIVMRHKTYFDYEVSSSFVNVASKVPALMCDGVSISFQQKSHQYDGLHNQQALERLPGVEEVQFLFNDNQMNYVTYKLDDSREILQRYLESFGSDYNTFRPERIAGDMAYGVGIPFAEFVNLTNQKFNVQIQSAANVSNPYIAYLYFHGLVEV